MFAQSRRSAKAAKRFSTNCSRARVMRRG
ncbi:hypothetical protein [Mycobacterium haemophilum]